MYTLRTETYTGSIYTFPPEYSRNFLTPNRSILVLTNDGRLFGYDDNINSEFATYIFSTPVPLAGKKFLRNFPEFSSILMVKIGKMMTSSGGSVQLTDSLYNNGITANNLPAFNCTSPPTFPFSLSTTSLYLDPNGPNPNGLVIRNNLNLAYAQPQISDVRINYGLLSIYGNNLWSDNLQCLNILVDGIQQVSLTFCHHDMSTMSRSELTSWDKFTEIWRNLIDYVMSWRHVMTSSDRSLSPWQLP